MIDMYDLQRNFKTDRPDVYNYDESNGILTCKLRDIMNSICNVHLSYMPLDGIPGYQMYESIHSYEQLRKTIIRSNSSFCVTICFIDVVYKDS